MSYAAGYERVPRKMLGLVISAQEAERARVARDLHDGIGQALTSVLLGQRLGEDALDGSDTDVRPMPPSGRSGCGACRAAASGSPDLAEASAPGS